MSEQDTTLNKFSKDDELEEKLELGPIEIDLPEEWGARELSELFTLITGNNYSGDQLSEEDNGGRIFLTLKSVNKGGGFNWDSIKYYTGEINDREIVEPGELLIANTDVTQDGDIVGYSIRVPDFDTEREVAASMDLSILRRRSNGVNIPYMEYLLQTDYIHSRMRAFSAGSTVLHLNTDLVESLSLPVPPLEEQRKIASVLYTVDQAIQKTEEIIDQTRKIKKGVTRDLLAQGVRDEEAQLVRMGPKQIEVPKSWDLTECGDLFEAVNGRAFSKDEWTDTGTRIIRIQDLREDAEADVNYASIEVDDQYHVHNGDLLFCWAGNIKTSLGTYIWDGEFSYLNQHIYNLKPKCELDKRFFKYSLNRYLPILKTMVSGSAGQIHITKGDFQSFELPHPPVAEQKKVADKINSIENEIEIQKEQKSQLKRLKQGLMQDLLSGEVRTHDKDIEVVDDVLQHG